MFIIDDILLLPVKGVAWLAEKTKEAAEKELYDEGKIEEELLRLHMRFEQGEISQNEHEKNESELLKRLEEIRNRKEEV